MASKDMLQDNAIGNGNKEKRTMGGVVGKGSPSTLGKKMKSNYACI